MSFSAFYTGLTGLKAHSVALNVIGNNLANVNTVGFKGSRVSFSELFAGASGGFGVNGAGMPHQVGSGVQLAAVEQMFQQGSMQPSDINTDLSINGSGFFALKSSDGLPVYTRAGNFSFNAEGYLVDPSGNRVQGYTQRDSNGSIIATGQPTDILIPTGVTAPPESTSYFLQTMNLNANATVDNPATTGADESQFFSPSVSVYDSLGGEHNLTIKFNPVDTDADNHLDQWTYTAQIDGVNVPGATGSGTITFDSNGRLATPAGNITFNLPAFANGAAAQTVEWRLYDSSNNPVVTGFQSDSAVADLSQNGYSSGRLQSLAVDDAGIISGVFTNGQTLQLAQISVASFNAPGGLLRMGNNTYAASLGSGPAALGTANSGGRGKVASRSLELSNVDITDQFTELIITERGYQSNSRIITTTDTMMQEALQLKR